MSRLKGSRTCLDCGVVHGRSPTAALCLNCRDARRTGRLRLPSYMAYQTNWNRSPAGKIYKDQWYTARREKILAARKARYAAQAKVPAIHGCESILCTNQFVRIKGSHKKFCDDCARIFYGPAYARNRGVRGRAWAA